MNNSDNKMPQGRKQLSKGETERSSGGYFDSPGWLLCYHKLSLHNQALEPNIALGITNFHCTSFWCGRAFDDLSHEYLML